MDNCFTHPALTLNILKKINRCSVVDTMRKDRFKNEKELIKVFKKMKIQFMINKNEINSFLNKNKDMLLPHVPTKY